MFCKYCGKEVQKDWVKCPYCGKELKEEFVQDNYESERYTVPIDGVNDKSSNASKKKKPIYKRVWFWIFIVMIGFMGCTVFGGSDTEETETKKTEKKNTFADQDFAELVGASEAELKKIGLKTGEDYLDYGALNGDINVSCTDGVVNSIMITGDVKTAPSFHGVKLGMSETEIKEKLSDKYTEELKGMNGKMYVNLDTGGAVNCQVNKGKVTTIMYMEFSEEELSELQSQSGAEEYIFPDSDTKYLSEDEVRSVEVDKLALGRNEIFARHGYIFKDETFRQYFESCSWYEGTVPSDQFNADSVLNNFEKKNVELIKSIENEVGGTSVDKFIGLSGVYICTTPLWDGFTGKIELGQPQNGAMSFSLGVLEQSYSVLSGTAVIIDSNTAQIQADGVRITLSWSNSENMYVVNEGSYSGKDADTIDVITDNMSYIRPTEFN